MAREGITTEYAEYADKRDGEGMATRKHKRRKVGCSLRNDLNLDLSPNPLRLVFLGKTQPRSKEA